MAGQLCALTGTITHRGQACRQRPNPTCPMCRSSYAIQELVTVDVRQRAATLVQAAWRGHLARRQCALLRLHRRQAWPHQQPLRGQQEGAEQRLQALFSRLSQGSAGLRQGLHRERRTWGL